MPHMPDHLIGGLILSERDSECIWAWLLEHLDDTGKATLVRVCLRPVLIQWAGLEG
jgi:hypothetical protein